MKAVALVPLTPAGPLDLPPAARLYAAFLAGRSPQTLRAYRADLSDFARFAGGSGPEDAAPLLLSGGPGRRTSSRSSGSAGTSACPCRRQ